MTEIVMTPAGRGMGTGGQMGAHLGGHLKGRGNR